MIRAEEGAEVLGRLNSVTCRGGRKLRVALLQRMEAVVCKLLLASPGSADGWEMGGERQGGEEDAQCSAGPWDPWEGLSAGGSLW